MASARDPVTVVCCDFRMGEYVFETLTRRASDSPDREALASGSERLTYREFEAKANQIAHHLLQIGVAPGDRVAVSMGKSATYVCCLYGIMKAGACYVPIDADYPAARMHQILSDCSIRVIIASSEVLTRLISGPELPPDLADALLSDGDSQAGRLRITKLADIANGPTHPPPISICDRDLAYILYTSGSTGKPKGVMLTHRNLMTFMEWCADAFDLTPEDRVINTAPFTFDIAGLDVYNAVWFGCFLYVVPDQRMINTVLRAIADEKITFMSTVPTILGALTQRPALFKRYDLTSLRTILSGAALCQPATMRKLHEQLPKASLWNIYGPTEATIYCLYHCINPAELSDDTPVPIGIPFENTQAYVLSPDGTECARGETGELVLRGSHVAAGYYENPEKTEAAFRNFPLQPHLNENVYYTGDVVRQDDKGLFHFLGRKDDLVKSRGYRIELNEIDLALASFDERVVESIAVAIPDPLYENTLHAALVLADGTSLTAEEVKAQCKGRIPDYMIPDEVWFFAELPKTTSGKISRKDVIADIQRRKSEM